MATPLAVKKMRRGPSELNGSTTLPELKAAGKGPDGPQQPTDAGVAATPNELMALVAEWPCVAPAVAILSVPRFVSRWRKRGNAALLLTMTIRSPAATAPISSNGSWIPLWVFVELARTVV